MPGIQLVEVQTHSAEMAGLVEPGKDSGPRETPPSGAGVEFAAVVVVGVGPLGSGSVR